MHEAFSFDGQDGSVAAAGAHFVMLAEADVLKPAVELGFLIDEARCRTCCTAGEEGGAESHRDNDRCEFHVVSPFIKPDESNARRGKSPARNI
jgi:hypothetical protein